MILSACGNTPPKASENIATDRFLSQTDENNHTVILDERQHLMFVNSIQGCKALHGDPANALKEATYFCEHLHFYGKDDWHVPTLDEIAEFSREMDAEGLVPYFTFPKCKRVVGLRADDAMGTINTHNASPKFAEVPLELPAGLRCVREY
jgi:hypothetical protein